MTFNEPTEWEKEEARAVLAKWGARAIQLVDELQTAQKNNDHHRGGEICKEMHENPQLFMLSIGLMTTMIVKLSEGGTEDDYSPLPWEVSSGDQLMAAAEEGNLSTYGVIAVDGMIRAISEDIERDGENAGTIEGIHYLLTGMDHQNLALIAAESIRRLVMQQSRG